MNTLPTTFFSVFLTIWGHTRLMLSPPRRYRLPLIGIMALACGLVLWQRQIAAPQIIHLKAPVLLSSVAFDTVESLRPSSDGRFIALQGEVSTGTTWNGKPQIALFSLEQKREVARWPASNDGDCVWDKRNRLWMAHGNGWDVWQAPWKTPTRAPAHIPLQIWKSAGSRMLAFDPNSQNVALSVLNQASLPVSIQLWRAGKRLCTAKITKNETQVGGNGTNIAAACWSPDGKQLAFSLSGYVGVDWDGPHELWVFDVASKQLRVVARGAVEEWVLADPFTQSTEPAWSHDGKTVFWGNQEFGINATTWQNGKTRQIFAPTWGGNAPTPSPSGRALAFVRYSNPEHAGHVTLVGAARDGSWWARGPHLDSRAQWTWNSPRDQLLFLAPDGPGTTALWKWDVSPQDAGP